MSAGGSAKVILIALGANLGIAVAKFFGAFMSGSASLLAEGIHSVVDCTNQVLLLVGNKKSKKDPTEKHPLGYGRESFFWSFVVTVLLFSMGGLFAIYEGVHKLSGHEAVTNFELAIGILGVSILLEGISFRAALKEIQATNPYGKLQTWFRRTTSAGLLVIFTEDAGALIGLIIASVCLTLSHVLGEPAWDAVGSILIGILLVVLAALLSVEIKSLIIGEAPGKDYRKVYEALLQEKIPGAQILNFIALQMGDNEVMVSLKITPGEIRDVDELIARINEFEAAGRAKFPEIQWSFVEPDHED